MVENTVTEFEGEEVEVVVEADMAGGRLDATLARVHTALSRNRIKDLILAGMVSVDGRTVSQDNKTRAVAAPGLPANGRCGRWRPF